jgi:hypothetical protein
VGNSNSFEGRKRTKPLALVWQTTLCESELSSTARLVGFVLSTYLSAKNGPLCWPSRLTLAKGAGLGLRTVDKAIVELESGGFVEIERSRGRSSHTYCVTLSPTAQELRRWEWATAQKTASNRADLASNGAGAAPESLESIESAAPLAAGAFGDAAAGALIEDDCGGCGQRLALVDDIYCTICATRRQAHTLVAAVRRDLGASRQELGR